MGFKLRSLEKRGEERGTHKRTFSRPGQEKQKEKHVFRKRRKRYPKKRKGLQDNVAEAGKKDRSGGRPKGEIVFVAKGRRGKARLISPPIWPYSPRKPKEKGNGITSPRGRKRTLAIGEKP